MQCPRPRRSVDDGGVLLVQQGAVEAANAMSEAPVLLHVDFLMAVSGAEVSSGGGRRGGEVGRRRRGVRRQVPAMRLYM